MPLEAGCFSIESRVYSREDYSAMLLIKLISLFWVIIFRIVYFPHNFCGRFMTELVAAKLDNWRTCLFIPYLEKSLFVVIFGIFRHLYLFGVLRPINCNIWRLIYFWGNVEIQIITKIDLYRHFNWDGAPRRHHSTYLTVFNTLSILIQPINHSLRNLNCNMVASYDIFQILQIIDKPHS